MTRTPLLGIFAAVSEDPDRALRTAQQIAEDVREQIRRARKAEAAARAEAEKWEQALAVVESRMGEHIAAVEEEKALTIGRENSKLRSNVQLDTHGQSKNVRIAASRTRKESEPRRLLLQAGETAATVAKHLGLKQAAVNHWFVGRNAIPRRHAQELLRWKKIPLATWPRIGE